MYKYYNYHKHSHWSQLSTPDSIVNYDDYFIRAKELGHDAIFTTEHGLSANVYDIYFKAKKEGLKTIFGIEGYLVGDINEKIRGNHIVLIALNKNGMRSINKINSRAHKEGFYYHPRIQLDWLLELPKSDVVVTSACINSAINVDGFIELANNHFDNFYLEVQPHNHDEQIKHNNKILSLSNKYDIPIISANDSHYIYSEIDMTDNLSSEELTYRKFKSSYGRELWLKSKNFTYGSEDSFILDYPKYETIVDRYLEQGVLTEAQIYDAISNTLIFEQASDLNLKKDIKMPNIYKELTPKQRYFKLEDEVWNRWEDKKVNIPQVKHEHYIEEIKKELEIIRETNDVVHTADYFLLNDKILSKAINEYGGQLTPSSRGSAGGFFINFLLDITKMDRIYAQNHIPIYPTRFISKTRLLETRSIPDIDANVSSPEPFYKASEDVLGSENVYFMAALGTMQKSGAFRTLCRAYDLEMYEYNDFSKSIANRDEEDLLSDEKLGEIYRESVYFRGIYDSVSRHPCAVLISDNDIESEYGVIKSGEFIIANMTSDISDDIKALKNDYLTVTDTKIVYDVYDMIDKPIPDMQELIEEKIDSKVWDLYGDGITSTLNQASTNYAKQIIKKYKPKNFSEVSLFVAMIRPGAKSLLNSFMNREDYTTGVDELDKILVDSDGYMVYQESVMAFLNWLGVDMDECYSIIKKISKKKPSLQKELDELEQSLRDNWKSKGLKPEDFDKAWKIVNDNIKYSFNSAHSGATALISLYQAYLKSNYPLQYYSVVFKLYEDDIDMTNDLVSELQYFGIQLNPIKFGKSKGNYTPDEKENMIYKGLSSIKYLNSEVGDELFDLSQNNTYDTFVELLSDMNEKTSLRSNQLEILILLDYFRDYGNSKKLLKLSELYGSWHDKSQLHKERNEDDILDFIRMGVTLKDIKESQGQDESPKLYRSIDFIKLIQKVERVYNVDDFTISDKIEAQQEYLGYINMSIDNIPSSVCVCTDLDDKYTPKLSLHSLSTGNQFIAKINKKSYKNYPVEKGDIINILDIKEKYGWQKDENDKWVRNYDRTDWWIESYQFVDDINEVKE